VAHGYHLRVLKDATEGQAVQQSGESTLSATAAQPEYILANVTAKSTADQQGLTQSLTQGDKILVITGWISNLGTTVPQAFDDVVHVSSGDHGCAQAAGGQPAASKGVRGLEPECPPGPGCPPAE
jgi:hypothetical protein